jgi:hypothetical protein
MVDFVISDAAVSALREADQSIPDADVARLSPLGDTHINMLGRYAFTIPAPTGLRPFRSPGADRAS